MNDFDIYNFSDYDLNIGNEDLSTFFHDFITKLRLFWNNLIQDHDKCIELYQMFLSEKISDQQYQELAKVTSLYAVSKKKLIENFNNIFDAINFINDKLSKLPNDPKYVIDNTDKDSRIFKDIIAFINRKKAPINPIFIQSIKASGSCYNLGYTTLNEFSSLINISNQRRYELEVYYDSILSIYETVVNEYSDSTTTTTNSDNDSTQTSKTSSAKSSVVSESSPLLAVCTGLLSCYETLVTHEKNILEELYKRYKTMKKSFENYSISSLNKSYFDAGLELFGLGKPKDKEVAFSNVFGKMAYLSKAEKWFAFDYINFPKHYYKDGSENNFYYTWIEHPYKKYEESGYYFKDYLTTKLNKTLEFVCRCINKKENEYGSFNATIDYNKVISGQEKRFYFLQLSSYFNDGYCMDAYIVFNRRVFILETDSDDLCVFIPNSPYILNEGQTSSFSKGSPAQKVILTKEDMEKLRSSSIKYGGESFKFEDDFVDGKYNKEITDVSVTPNDNSVADVDVRIDLTPDREQKLLKMFSYNLDNEIDVYGLEGLVFKSNKIDQFTSKYLDNYYNTLADQCRVLSKVDPIYLDAALSTTNTDIISKEKFLDKLKYNYKKLEHGLLALKSFAEDGVVNDKDMKEIENESLDEQNSSDKVTMSSANFNDRDDVLYLCNRLLYSKLKVNLSQYKYLKNTIFEKLKTNKYNESNYSDISKLFNSFNIVFINTCNMLSKGKRFVDDLVIATK